MVRRALEQSQSGQGCQTGGPAIPPAALREQRTGVHLLQDPLPLGFGQLHCEWEAMDQEIENLLRKLHGLCLGSRVHEIPRPPEMPTYQRQTIRERRLSLVV